MDSTINYVDEFSVTAPDLSRQVNVMVLTIPESEEDTKKESIVIDINYETETSKSFISVTAEVIA